MKIINEAMLFQQDQAHCERQQTHIDLRANSRKYVHFYQTRLLIINLFL